MSQLLDVDPNEKAKFSGWVKAKRSDTVSLGGGFERRFVQLFSNRLDFWKSDEDAAAKPRGQPKDSVGLHLLRRLRYMDHAPSSSKTDVIELYMHARTIYFVTDDDNKWSEWLVNIDNALRDSTFDFRDESEKERDLFAGHAAPASYRPPKREGSHDRSREGSFDGGGSREGSGSLRSSHSHKNDPMLNLFKRSGSSSAQHSPRKTDGGTPRKQSLSGTPGTPSKTPRTDSTPGTPKRSGEERV